MNKEQKMKTKILIGNISEDTTRDQLADLLVAKIGKVDCIDMPQNEKSKKSRGFAVVHLTNDMQAIAAVEELDGYSLNGRALAITVEQPAHKPRKWYKLFAR